MANKIRGPLTGNRVVKAWLRAAGTSLDTKVLERAINEALAEMFNRGKKYERRSRLKLVKEG